MKTIWPPATPSLRTGLVWTFTLRDDAYFTDGEKLTAEDVAFTLETAKAAQGSVDLTYMDKAEAVDEHTVVITLKQPTSIFLNTLASVGIVPRARLLRRLRPQSHRLRSL